MKHKKNIFIFTLVIICISIFTGVLLINTHKLPNSINSPLQNSSENIPDLTNNSNSKLTDESHIYIEDNSDHADAENSNLIDEKDTELFEKYYDKADELLNSMTLDEKVSQMFLVRYPGTTTALQEVSSEYPGGYILFGKDFSNSTKNDIINEISNLQNNSKINLFLAVDEEGGTVVRVSSYSNFRKSKFLSPQELFKIGGLQAILEDSTEKTSLLKSIGLNMNLVPVVDIPTNSSSFIYSRSYGQNAEDTATYASELIKQMNTDGIIASMKHFPGYGDNVDTHTGIAVDNRPYSNFETSDFLPFISGIKSCVPTIMVNHNIINCIDSTKPASLSENVHKILRENLHFSGLIITDDLAMAAVKNYVSNGEAAVQAVLAGNDLIISSSFKSQKQEVLDAVRDGRISEDLINTAVRRILACKYAYGIIE